MNRRKKERAQSRPLSKQIGGGRAVGLWVARDPYARRKDKRQRERERGARERQRERERELQERDRERERERCKRERERAREREREWGREHTGDLKRFSLAKSKSSTKMAQFAYEVAMSVKLFGGIHAQEQAMAQEPNQGQPRSSRRQQRLIQCLKGTTEDVPDWTDPTADVVFYARVPGVRGRAWMGGEYA